MLTHASLIRLCHARDRLREDECAPSIDALAREAGLSTGQFIRQFAAVFGETPHQLRIAARLDRAKTLLAGGHSVTQVCYEIGFSSLGSFSDLFARRVGVAPSAYRRRVHVGAWFPATSPSAVHPGCFELMCAAFGADAGRAAQFSRSGFVRCGADFAALNHREFAVRYSGRTDLSDASGHPVRAEVSKPELAGLLSRSKPEPMKIKLTSIMVDDQDKALAFYTDVLGFRKKHDIPVHGPFRWITVVSAQGPDDIELSLEPNANPAGKTFQEALLAQGIPATAFEVDDVRKEFERLKARGVAFTTEPKAAGPVTIAVFADTCGNLIQIYQPPA